MIENSVEHRHFYVHKQCVYVPRVIWEVTKRPRIGQELGQFQMAETQLQKAYTTKRKGIFFFFGKLGVGEASCL